MPMQQARILIAEDDALLRKLISRWLQALGYETILAANGREALSLFEQHHPDLLVLDVMMPYVDGFTVCRKIRRRSDVPIIMVTARSLADDRLRGFEEGVDDYLCKPFEFKELTARIQAILKRANRPIRRHRDTIEIGRVCIDLGQHRALVDDQQVHLSPTEFSLLHFFMTHAGEVVTKESLFHSIWGYEVVSGINLVEVAIRRLRSKIERDPSVPEYIQTIRGTGYCFQGREERRDSLQLHKASA